MVLYNPQLGLVKSSVVFFLLRLGGHQRALRGSHPSAQLVQHGAASRHVLCVRLPLPASPQALGPRRARPLQKRARLVPRHLGPDRAHRRARPRHPRPHHPPTPNRAQAQDYPVSSALLQYCVRPFHIHEKKEAEKKGQRRHLQHPPHARHLPALLPACRPRPRPDLGRRLRLLDR